jgi:hypothetical protein
MGWSALVSCVCELILLHCEIFYLVTAVHIPQFMFVISQTPHKWQQVESNRCNGRHLHFFRGALVFCARLAWKQLILPMLRKSNLFSSIKDSMIKRRSNGSTAQCGGPAVVLLNLQHHIQSRGKCYTLATVPLGKLTTVSRVGPRVSLYAVVKSKFPPPPEMNSKCLVIQNICWLSHLTSFVWVSVQRVTLATNIKQTIL